MSSQLEEDFLTQLREAGLPEPVRELVFAKPRRWRFDFCWPDQRVAFEVEGAVWSNGRHTRGGGFLGDIEKYNAAVWRGWYVYRVTAATIKDGSAIALAKEVLNG